jgi:Spy/CpxP family protein refolding chaperone
MKQYATAVIPALLILAGSIVLTGCSRQPVYCDNNFSERVLSHADRWVHDLNLTSEQRAVYEELRKEAKDGINRAIEERKGVSARISAELDKEKVDMDAIASIMKDNPPVREETYRLALDGMLKFYAVLDENQKRKVVAKLKKARDRFNCAR